MTVLDYLSQRGIQVKKRGRLYFASSPFSQDTNWSFCVYTETDSFYDWSTGRAGNAYKLASLIENITYREAKEKYDRFDQPIRRGSSSLSRICDEGAKRDSTHPCEAVQCVGNAKERPRSLFDCTKYFVTESAAQERIIRYAASRGITRGYFAGKVVVGKDEGFEEKEALGFLHYDENEQPCGAKFRFIEEVDGRRFTARGKLGYYCPAVAPRAIFSASGSFRGGRLGIVEGEANANSLQEWLLDKGLGDIIISGGGVGKPPPVPKEFIHLPRFVIIDYDGDAKLYEERVKIYKHLDATPIKLILPKGEDINSLYIKNQMYLIENLL